MTDGNGHDSSTSALVPLDSRAYQEQQARRAAAFSQLAEHGLSRWGGYVMDEFLVQLQGLSGRKLYREMSDNCPVVGALLQAIEMAMRAVSWTVKPASEKRADEDLAEFVDSCLHDMSFSWEDTLSDVLTMLPYGFAYSELVYKRREGATNNPSTRSRYSDGRIGWRKLVTIAQETVDHWEFQPDGGIDGVWQQPPDGGGQRYIPIEKSLLFRTTVRKNSPEGRSILRSAYPTWHYRKNVLEILGIGLERDLTGLPVITGPEGVDLFDQNNSGLLTTYKKIVRDLKADEQAGVVLNYGATLDLVASPGTPKHDAVQVLEYLDRRIALTCLAQFLLLGMEKVGSYALASSQSDLFILSLSGWVDGIRAVFNQHAIPRLLRLNGLTVETPPTLERGQIGSPNLTELAEYVNKLASAAVLNPDEDTEAYLRKIANLPELTEPRPVPVQPGQEPQEPAPRPTLTRERLMRRRELVGDEQTLRELGYSEESIRRLLAQKQQSQLANTNIGGELLKAFERGHLTGRQEE